MNDFSLYWRYVRMHSKTYLQYKGWPMNVLMSLVYVITDPLDVILMLDRFGSVGRWSASSILMMYALALVSFVLAELFGRGFDYFPLLVRTGEFDRILLRPRSLFIQSITLRFHLNRLARVIGGGVLLGLTLRAQGVQMTPANAALLLGALTGGMLTYIGVFIISSAISFYSSQENNWISAFTNGSYQLAKVPPEYLPKWLAGAFKFVMPMLMFSYYPAASICGWGEAYFMGFLALPVGALFFAASLLLFRVGVRHYRSTGS